MIDFSLSNWLFGCWIVWKTVFLNVDDQALHNSSFLRSSAVKWSFRCFECATWQMTQSIYSPHFKIKSSSLYQRNTRVWTKCFYKWPSWLTYCLTMTRFATLTMISVVNSLLHCLKETQRNFENLIFCEWFEKLTEQKYLYCHTHAGQVIKLDAGLDKTVPIYCETCVWLVWHKTQTYNYECSSLTRALMSNKLGSVIKVQDSDQFQQTYTNSRSC